MTTRAQKVEAFDHVVETVLEFAKGTAVRYALEDSGYNDIDDLITMDKDEVMALKYFERDSKGAVTAIDKVVPMKARKKLLHLLWWRDFLVSQMTSKLLQIDEWKALTKDAYDVFRTNQAPNIARASAITSSGGGNAVGITKSQVSEFQKGHKRDVSVYMSFAGDWKHWFRVKRNWTSNFAADGVIDIVQPGYMIPVDGTEAKSLFDAKNRYVYNVFNACVKGGQAMVILRKHEVLMDGREVHLGMVNFYERKANLSLIRLQCMADIAELKLTKNYPGGSLKFFQNFQNTYLDLENATGKEIDDDKKIGSLNASLEDERYASVQTTIETVALQSGSQINYADYLQSMITHAENLRTTGRRNANRAETRRNGSGRGRGRNGGGNSNDPDAWKTDLTAFIPYRIYKDMSEAEIAKRKEAKQQKMTGFILHSVCATEKLSVAEVILMWDDVIATGFSS